MIDLHAKDWDRQVVGSEEWVPVDFWHDVCVRCTRFDPEIADVAGDVLGKLKFARFNLLGPEKIDHP